MDQHAARLALGAAQHLGRVDHVSAPQHVTAHARKLAVKWVDRPASRWSHSPHNHLDRFSPAALLSQAAQFDEYVPVEPIRDIHWLA
jgi:hypothetical protein